MKHSEIHILLYDYLRNELSADEHRRVNDHLSSCQQCSNELEEIEHAIRLLPSASTQPSEDRDGVYWKSLALSVEREIRAQHKSKRSPLAGFAESVRSLFLFRPGYAYALGGSVVALVLAILVFRFQPDEKPQVAGNTLSPADSTFLLAQQQADLRVSSYFRKSKTLLVGLANMKTGDEHNIDLTAERKLSRKLVHEARYLQHQPLDDRSAKLVQDLEKILVELANLEDGNDLPNVELIRSGINQENLLFKIRMAEASYDTTNSSKRIY